MNSKGWIAAMRNELETIGIDSTPLQNPSPRNIANVRFSPDSVTFFDPRPVVNNNHKIYRLPRYHPLDWDGTFPPIYLHQINTFPPSNQSDDDDPTRSEEARTRAAVEATSYNPRHVKLQNTLYRKLCLLHGQDNVFYGKGNYERGFVDIILRHNQTTTFKD